MYQKIKYLILRKLGIAKIQHEIESLQQQNIELKTRLKITESELQQSLPALQNFAKDFKDFCSIDLDIHPQINAARGNNTIILTGNYKSKGFIRFYDLRQEDFDHFVGKVQHLKQYGSIRNIDTPFIDPQFLSHFNLT